MGEKKREDKVLDDFLSHPVGQRIKARMDEQDYNRRAIAAVRHLRREKMMDAYRAGKPLTVEEYEEQSRITPVEVAQALGDLEALSELMEVGDTIDKETLEIRDKDGNVKVPGIKREGDD